MCSTLKVPLLLSNFSSFHAIAAANQNLTLKLDGIIGSLANSELRSYCLSQTDANQIADSYSRLMGTFDFDLARAIVAPDFVQYSTSFNTLINNCSNKDVADYIPLLSPEFASREAFIAGQSQQVPVHYRQLDLWFTCDTVIVRNVLGASSFDNNANARPVVGMLDMRTTPAPVGNRFPYYIQTIYSEFDVVAYIANLKDEGVCPYVSNY